MAFGRDLVRNVSGAVEEPAPAGEVFGPLQVDNRHCLAQRGGCFSCIDHCPQQAISIRLGVGIAVDTALCDGCGQCVEHCPVEPKVITMKPLPTT
jgi:Pyruvate/2-oxoacid:ferredoxin oxidoreductase delta subunit